MAEWKAKSCSFEGLYNESQEKIDSQLREFAILKEELSELKEINRPKSNKIDGDTSAEWNCFHVFSGKCFFT